MRLPRFLNLTTSKTKLVCGTPSIFQLDSIKHEAILKNVKLSAELTPSCQCFLRFFHPISHRYCAATRKWCQVMGSVAPVTQNHLRKPDDLMLQNATLLRKSAPWPPNISDENVSCIAPATRNASLRILFKCSTPAIVFGNATKLSRFAHLWQGAESLALATQNERFNIQKWREHVVVLAFRLRHVLGAATACTFSTSQLRKVVQDPQFLRLSTSKSASGRTTACNCSSLICPDGSAPAALASLLFDHPEPQIIGKTQCFATFLPFRAPGSSFFWDFLFSDLLSSSLLFSILLLHL